MLFGLADAQNIQKHETYFPGRGIYRPIKPLPVEFNDVCEMEFEFRKGENELSAKSNKNGKITVVALLKTGKINRLKQNVEMGSLAAFLQSKCRGGNIYNAKVGTLASENTYFDMKFFDKFEFTTVSKNGVSYEFSGNFLARSRLEKGIYIELEGVLKKLKVGKEIANTNIRLFRRAYL